MEDFIIISINSIEYSEDIQNQILSNLDGWRIADNETTDNINESINPFITDGETIHKANKVITSMECESFYDETLDNALLYTNRLNIDDLTEIESRAFIRAVCKWTASNLWNKYNIRVNNEDMEDTYVQSYGGLLYHSAMKALNPFIIQRITGLSSMVEDVEINPWLK